MLKFLVKQQKIEILERQVIASDQIAFVTLKFIFEGEWKKFHKVVQFTQDDETYNLVLGFDGLSCLLPAELHTGTVKMSVFGYDTNNTSGLRATTVPVTLHIRQSGFDGESTPIPPTPDLYQQLISQISNSKNGESAYEIAVKNGFSGTEKEWLESLHGEDGISPDMSKYAKTTDVEKLISPISEKAHTHQNFTILEKITDENFSLNQQFQDWTNTVQKINTRIDMIEEKFTEFSAQVEQLISDLQSQIQNSNTKNCVNIFQYGDDSAQKYVSEIGLILNGGYFTMTDFMAKYPHFCSPENDYALSYNQQDFGWDTEILTVCTKELSLNKKSSIVFNCQSGANESGKLYLVKKPAYIDTPITIYVKDKIDSGQAISLDFQWLYSEKYVNILLSCMDWKKQQHTSDNS